MSISFKIYLPNNTSIRPNARVVYNPQTSEFEPKHDVSSCWCFGKKDQQKKKRIENELAWKMFQTTLSQNFKISIDEIEKICGHLIPTQTTEKLTFQNFQKISQKVAKKFTERTEMILTFGVNKNTSYHQSTPSSSQRDQRNDHLTLKNSSKMDSSNQLTIKTLGKDSLNSDKDSSHRNPSLDALQDIDGIDTLKFPNIYHRATSENVLTTSEKLPQPSEEKHSQSLEQKNQNT